MVALWELKSRLLAAEDSGEVETAESLTDELDRRVDELLAEANNWIDARDNRFEEAGLPIDALKELIGLATRDWARTRGGPNRYEIPDELLNGFPLAAQTFFRSGRSGQDGIGRRRTGLVQAPDPDFDDEAPREA